MKSETTEVLEGTMTDEEIDQVAKELKAYGDGHEIISKIRDMEDKNYIPEDHSDDLIFEDIDDTIGVDLVDAAITKMQDGKDEEGIQKLKGFLDGAIPEEELLTMLNVVKRYRAGEKFSVYNALPPTMKNKIKEQFASEGVPIVDKQQLALFSNLLVEQFITEVIDVASSRDIIDFNKSLESTLGQIPNIVSMYGSYTRENMEVTLLQKANEMDEQGHHKAAEVYRSCSKSFTDSYTYVHQYKALEKAKVRNRLLKDNCFFKKFCNEIDTMNNSNRFNMISITAVAETLRNVNDVIFDSKLTEEDIKSFTILLCKSFRLLDANDMPSAMLMYYTIFNIQNLVMYIEEENNEFNETIIVNIKKLFNEIWKAENDSRRFEIVELEAPVFERWKLNAYEPDMENDPINQQAQRMLGILKGDTNAANTEDSNGIESH